MSYRSVLLLCASSPCVSPLHCRLTSLSSGSIFESQVRSSQVLPFRHTTMCLWILKEDTGNVLVRQSLHSIFFIGLWRIYDNNLIWRIAFSSSLVLHVQDIVELLNACLLGESARSRAGWRSTHPNHSLEPSKKKKSEDVNFLFDTVKLKLLKTIKSLIFTSPCLSPHFN